jgi:hypothetical protein
MVTDAQVRLMRQTRMNGKTQAAAAAASSRRRRIGVNEFDFCAQKAPSACR